MNLIPQFIHRRIAHRPNLLKIVDNIGWLFLDRILRMGAGLFVGVWLARYLGPEQFGLFSFAAAFVGLFGAIAGLGLQSIVVRDIVRNPAGKEETLGTAAALQFIGGLVAYGLIIGTILWLRADDAMAKLLVAILGSTMLFKASEVAIYWFESQVLSKYVALVKNSTFVAFAALKVVFILTNAPLTAFAWAIMAEAFLVALLLLIMIGLRGPKLWQLRVTLSRAKCLMQDSWPLLLSGVATMIYMTIDQIMLGQMVGDQAVGIYSAAVRISEVWYFIPMMIVASVFPSIIEARQRSKKHYYRRLQNLYDLMVGLSFVIALPMTFLSKPLVTLLFGEAFSASGMVLAIHIWAGVFVFLGVASGKSFLAENRQILSFQRAALGAVVNIAFNAVLIPYYGPVGAAISTVISQAMALFIFDAFQPVTRGMFLMKVRSMNLLRFRGYIRRGDFDAE